EVEGGLLDDLVRPFVAGHGRVGDQREVLTHAVRLAAEPELGGETRGGDGDLDDPAGRGERLETTATPAPTGRPVDVEHHVPDLADVGGRTAVDVATHDQAEPDAGGHVDGGDVNGRGDPPDPVLPDRRAGRIVLDRRRQVDQTGECGLDVEQLPVGCVRVGPQDVMARVLPAGNGDADTQHRGPVDTGPGDQLAHLA